MKFIAIFLSLIILLSQSVAAKEATLDEMIGQMIMIGFHGDCCNCKSFKRIQALAKNGEIGGVIFFKHNVKNKCEFEKMTKTLKNTKTSLPLLLAVDQEGGYVQRLSADNGFENFPSFKQVAKKMTPEEAQFMYEKMAQMLENANLNMNFSPCVDLDINQESIIAKKERSFSSKPEIVEKYAKAVILPHQKHKIITVLKHFPGHGSAKGDTHANFVDCTKNYSQTELEPYKNLVNFSDFSTILVAHTLNANFDEKFPSSLSEKTIKFLRNELNYNGIVVTDDLQMLAIKNNFSLEDAVVLAINASDDILVFGNFANNDTKLPQKINKIVKDAIKQGKIKQETIEKSYERILNLKEKLN